MSARSTPSSFDRKPLTPYSDQTSWRGKLSSWLGAVQRFLEAVRAFFKPALVSGPSLVIGLVAGLLLVGPDQMRESIRVLGEAKLRVTMFLASAILASLTSWYWARVVTYRLMPEARRLPKGSALRLGVGFFPRLAGTLPVLFVAIGAYLAVGIDPYAEAEVVTRLRILEILAALCSLALPAFYWGRRVILDARPTESNGAAGYTKTATSILALVLVISVILGVAVTVNPLVVVRWQWMNPATLLEIGSASWIAIVSALAYYGKKHRWPYVTLLVAASVIFTWLNWNDDHEIRYLARRRAAQPRIGEAFDAWLRARADATSRTGPYPVFLIAAEGGGIRAAYITAQILSAIQDVCPAFAQHVFAISGVSGGSLGSGVFAGLTARQAANRPGLPCDAGGQSTDAMRKAADRVLARDFLSPVVAMSLYPDLVQRFLFVPFGKLDRARALEDGFARAWRDEFPTGWGFDSSFYDLRSGPSSVVPALFLNTTQVETGDRVAIANLYPDASVASRLTTMASRDSGLNMSMSTAVGLSARFTYVTPEGKIAFANGAVERFVDGGYFENSGAGTVADILYSIRSWARAHNAVRSIRPIILRIGYDEGSDTSRSRIDNSGFSDAISPVVALLNTRGTRGNVVVEQLRAAVSEAQSDSGMINMIDLVLTRGRQPLILGWLLSEAARADVRSRTTPRACSTGAPISGDSVHLTTRKEDQLRAGYCAVFGLLRNAAGTPHP
jgi:hypothetical protein